ncbi:ERF family protein [Ligilactobacillus ruminis]|uniref:ERF family protein n=1 Tax=Ligilactobacillus ruminis TaxID=1623 RepID=UPI0022E84AD9|nr:ERF family protein [Ligilactobacillus ruminis]
MEASEEMKSLYKALAKFRQQLKQPAKDGSNPYLKSTYVTLDGVIKAVDTALEGTGLSYIQEAATSDGLPAVRTVLFHEDGGMMASGWLSLPLKNGATPQDVGSLLTYAKRYQLAAFFGVSSDVDDDGNSASSQGDQRYPQSAGYHGSGNRGGNVSKSDNLQRYHQVLQETAARLSMTAEEVKAAVASEVGQNPQYANYKNWSPEAKQNVAIRVMKDMK